MNRLIVSGLSVVVVLGLFAVSAVAQQLDYRQRQSLKDATYYLDQSEGLVAAVVERSADWKAGDASVSVDDVQTVLNTTKKAGEYLGNADKRLKELPQDNADVTSAVERAATIRDDLAAAEKKAVEVHKGLSKVLEQGIGDDYKVDFDRLKEINQTFANPQVLQSQPEQAVEVVKLMEPSKKERQRIAEKYADLLKQPTDESRRMQEVLEYYDEVYPPFEKAVREYADAAPAQIEKDIAGAMEMTKRAVDEKKPLFLGDEGGVKQRLGWAATRLSVLSAIDPEGDATNAAQQKLADAEAEVKKAKAALIDSIIESNQVPDERYSGPDADEVRALLKEKWTKDGNGDELIKVGVNGNDWKRTTKWEWSDAEDAFVKVDKSRLQGFVLAKQDDTIAVVHYVNLVKDHLAGDSVEAFFLSDPKGEPDVSVKVLMKNVR